MDLRRTPLIVTLLWFSAGFSGLAQAVVCDADKDGDVDRHDLSLIIGARQTPANGRDDPRDVDGDGKITVHDARSCVRQCSLPRCVAGPASSSTGNAGKVTVPKPVPVQKAAKTTSKAAAKVSDQSSTPIQNRTIVRGSQWKVKRGDTLYAIARAVFPGDARKQTRLRQDIVALNPGVFANGANKMSVGVVLKLPDYVVQKGASEKQTQPAPAPAPVPVPTEVVSEPAPAPVITAPSVEARAETPREVSSPTSRANSGIVLDLGFSYGGDDLIEFDNWLNITGGTGFHLRLGYEQMFLQGSGYRISLGLQYNYVNASDGDGSFRDNYLQLAYQYRAKQIVYGIGVISHAGATLDDDGDSFEFDSATGAVVYLEHVGGGTLAGWGLSYTSLDIEEKSTSTTVDASRIELYYSWRF